MVALFVLWRFSALKSGVSQVWRCLFCDGLIGAKDRILLLFNMLVRVQAWHRSGGLFGNWVMSSMGNELPILRWRWQGSVVSFCGCMLDIEQILYNPVRLRSGQALRGRTA